MKNLTKIISVIITSVFLLASFSTGAFAGKKILYFLFIFALTFIFTNSVFSTNCKSTGNLEDVSSNVLIKLCFHSSLLSCQIPKLMVKIIENIVKIKKG